MIVQAPDGKTIDFGEMQPDQITGAMQKMYAAAPQQSPDMGDQAIRQLGLTSRYLIEGPSSIATGIGDLANTGINAVTGGINNLAGTNIPQLGMPSQSVSNALTEIGLPNPETPVEKGVGFASKLATGLAPGGEGLINSGKQIASNAQEMLGNLLAKSDPVPQTSAEARALASQLYQQANDSGGILKPDLTNRFVTQSSSIAPQTAEGQLVAGETPITQIANRIQALNGKPLSLPAVQEIDEHLGGLIDKEYGLKGLSKDGRQLVELQSMLRDIVNNAGPEDVIGGQQGFSALKDARQAWSQASKMGDIEKIQNRASLSDNPATTIKSGVRTLLSNPARTRGWATEELEALQQAGNRGLVGGALHVMGSRLVPYVASAIGEGVGGLPGAALGGALGHGGSTLARNAATAIQAAKLAKVLKTMGGNLP